MPTVRWFALALAGISVVTLSNSRPLAAEEIYLSEKFGAAPALSGWQIYGDTNLFGWNAGSQSLDVTWDSSRQNSIFYHPLGIELSRTNDFILEFDLLLSDVAIGTTPEKPYTFELAVGLTDLASVTNAGFFRGTGFNSPNLVELDYFPDSGYGATVSTTLISSNNEWSTGGFTYPMALSTGDVYHVEMRFVAAKQKLITRMTRNGERCAPLQEARLESGFSDFHVDQMAVSSYSDAGQDPAFAGSLLAHGKIDNFLFIVPPPIGEVAGSQDGKGWQVQFVSHTNWLYRLERTEDFLNWTELTSPIAGTGADMTLSDTNPPPGKAFYHVRASRP